MAVRARCRRKTSPRGRGSDSTLKDDDWDREIERDVAAGRLDHLAAEALADLRAGRARPL